MTLGGVDRALMRRVSRQFDPYASEDLPMTLDAGERKPWSRLALGFKLEPVSGSGTAMRLVRNPHASEGDRWDAVVLDAWAGDPRDEDEKVAAAFATAARLLREDRKMVAAGEDPMLPPAHRHRCHHALPAIAAFNGWSMDDVVAPAMVDDGPGRTAARSDDGIHTLSLVQGEEPDVVRLSRMLFRRHVSISYLTLRDADARSRMSIQMQETRHGTTLTIEGVQLPETVLGPAAGRRVGEIVSHPTLGPIEDLVVAEVAMRTNQAKSWLELRLDDGEDRPGEKA